LKESKYRLGCRIDGLNGGVASGALLNLGEGRDWQPTGQHLSTSIKNQLSCDGQPATQQLRPNRFDVSIGTTQCGRGVAPQDSFFETYKDSQTIILERHSYFQSVHGLPYECCLSTPSRAEKGTRFLVL